MSFPFESDIVDKKTFLEIIYQELFEGRDDYEKISIVDLVYSI